MGRIGRLLRLLPLGLHDELEALGESLGHELREDFAGGEGAAVDDSLLGVVRIHVVREETVVRDNVVNLEQRRFCHF